MLDNDEPPKLRDLVDGCRELLLATRDPVHRRTISDVLSFLESKLTEMGRAARQHRTTARTPREPNNERPVCIARDRSEC
jgi:hypothetical protein